MHTSQIAYSHNRENNITECLWKIIGKHKFDNATHIFQLPKSLWNHGFTNKVSSLTPFGCIQYSNWTIWQSVSTLATKTSDCQSQLNKVIVLTRYQTSNVSHSVNLHCRHKKLAHETDPWLLPFGFWKPDSDFNKAYVNWIPNLLILISNYLWSTTKTADRQLQRRGVARIYKNMHLNTSVHWNEVTLSQLNAGWFAWYIHQQLGCLFCHHI